MSSGRLHAAGQLTTAAGSDSSGELISSYHHAGMSCRVSIPIHLCSISISLGWMSLPSCPGCWALPRCWGCHCHPSPLLSRGDAMSLISLHKALLSCFFLKPVTRGTHRRGLPWPQEKHGHSWDWLWELWEYFMQKLYVPRGRLCLLPSHLAPWAAGAAGPLLVPRAAAQCWQLPSAHGEGFSPWSSFTCCTTEGRWTVDVRS